MSEPSPVYAHSIKDTVSVDEIITVLNDLISIDADAMHRFVTTLTPCNAQFELGYRSKMLVDNLLGFWFLSVLNRFFSNRADNQYLIEAVFDDSGGLGSPRLVKFQRKVYPPLMNEKELADLMSAMEL